jgi:predicted O-methyltransferase YrrM
VLEDYEDSHFDLVLVDGVARDCAMMTAIAKVKPGGYIYMDNTDSPDRSYRVARSMLMRAAGGEANVHVFNDLTPSRVYVTEGTLARVSNKIR